MCRKFTGYVAVLGLVFWVVGCGPTAFMIRPVPAQQKLQETEIEKDKGHFVTDKIAVIDVDGLLINSPKWGLLNEGENPVSLFAEKLDKAAQDRDVKGIILRINSPGGTVGATDLMYRKLKDFKQQSGKPAVACMLSIATSGA